MNKYFIKNSRLVKTVAISIICAFLLNDIAYAFDAKDANARPYTLSATSRFKPIASPEENPHKEFTASGEAFANTAVAENFKGDAGLLYTNFLIGWVLERFGSSISAEGLRTFLARHLTDIDSRRFDLNKLYKEGKTFCLPLVDQEGRENLFRYYLPEDAPGEAEGKTSRAIGSGPAKIIHEEQNEELLLIELDNKEQINKVLTRIRIPIPKSDIDKEIQPQHYSSAVGNFIKSLSDQGRFIPQIDNRAVYGCERCYKVDLGGGLGITLFSFRHTNTVFEMYTRSYVDEFGIGRSDPVGYGSYTIDREKGVAGLAFHIFAQGLDKYKQKTEGYRHKEYTHKFFEAKLRYLYNQEGIRKFTISNEQLGDSQFPEIRDDSISSGALIFYVKKYGFSLVNKKADAALKEKLNRGKEFSEDEIKSMLEQNPQGLYLDVPVANPEWLAKYLDMLRSGEPEAAILANPKKYAKTFFEPLYGLLCIELERHFSHAEQFIDYCRETLRERGPYYLYQKINEADKELVNMLGEIDINDETKNASIRFYGLLLFFVTTNPEPYFDKLYDTFMKTKEKRDIAPTKKGLYYHSRLNSTIHLRSKNWIFGRKDATYMNSLRYRSEDKEFNDEKESANGAKIRKALAIWAEVHPTEEDKGKIQRLQEQVTVIELRNIRTSLLFCDPENDVARLMHVGRRRHVFYFSKLYLDQLNIDSEEDMRELAFFLKRGREFLDLHGEKKQDGGRAEKQKILDNFTVKFFENGSGSQLVDIRKLKKKLARLMKQDVVEAFKELLETVQGAGNIVDGLLSDSVTLDVTDSQQFAAQTIFGERRNECRRLMYLFEGLDIHTWAEEAYRAMAKAAKIVQTCDPGGLKPVRFQIDLVFTALRWGHLTDFIRELEVLLSGTGYPGRKIKRSELGHLERDLLTAASSGAHSFESELRNALQAQVEMAPPDSRKFVEAIAREADNLLVNYFRKHFTELEYDQIDEDNGVSVACQVDENGNINAPEIQQPEKSSKEGYTLGIEYAGTTVKLLPYDMERWASGFRVYLGGSEIAQYNAGDGQFLVVEIPPQGELASDSSDGLSSIAAGKSASWHFVPKAIIRPAPRKPAEKPFQPAAEPVSAIKDSPDQAQPDSSEEKKLSGTETLPRQKRTLIRVEVSPDDSYEVVKTRHVFNPENKLLAEEIKKRNAFFVVDKGIGEQQIEELKNYMVMLYPDWSKADVKRHMLILAGGEKVKNGLRGVFNVFRIAYRAWRAKLDKQSAFVLIGGGATLDVAGFAGSIFHRGTDHIRIPTTLLAQDDAGIGVKNGINFFGQKNFFGTYYPPQSVLIDPFFLKTANPRIMSDGIAEIIKVTLLKDKEDFEKLEAAHGILFHLPEALKGQVSETLLAPAEELLWISIKNHLGQITKDPRERISARPLDYGHAWGHRLEIVTRHRLSHGQGVAIGMAIDSYISWRRGYITEKEFKRIIKLIRAVDLPIYDKAATFDNLWPGLEDFRAHLGGKLTITLLGEEGAASGAEGIGKKQDISREREPELEEHLKEELEEALEYLKQLAEGTSRGTRSAAYRKNGSILEAMGGEAENEGYMKAISRREPGRDEHTMTGRQEQAFVQEALKESVQEIYGIKMRILETTAHTFGAYRFKPSEHGFPDFPEDEHILVLNKNNTPAINAEARYHEAREIFWAGKTWDDGTPLTEHEVHIIASAEGVLHFSRYKELTPYHKAQLENIPLRRLRAVAKEDEKARQELHHNLLNRANSELGADINMENIKEYEESLRLAVNDLVEEGMKTRKLDALKRLVDRGGGVDLEKAAKAQLGQRDNTAKINDRECLESALALIGVSTGGIEKIINRIMLVEPEFSLDRGQSGRIGGLIIGTTQGPMVLFERQRLYSLNKGDMDADSIVLSDLLHEAVEIRLLEVGMEIEEADWYARRMQNVWLEAWKEEQDPKRKLVKARSAVNDKMMKLMEEMENPYHPESIEAENPTRLGKIELRFEEMVRNICGDSETIAFNDFPRIRRMFFQVMEREGDFVSRKFKKFIETFLTGEHVVKFCRYFKREFTVEDLVLTLQRLHTLARDPSKFKVAEEIVLEYSLTDLLFQIAPTYAQHTRILAKIGIAGETWEITGHTGLEPQIMYNRVTKYLSDWKEAVKKGSHSEAKQKLDEVFKILKAGKTLIEKRSAIKAICDHFKIDVERMEENYIMHVIDDLNKKSKFIEHLSGEEFKELCKGVAKDFYENGIVRLLDLCARLLKQEEISNLVIGDFIDRGFDGIVFNATHEEKRYVAKANFFQNRWVEEKYKRNNKEYMNMLSHLEEARKQRHINGKDAHITKIRAVEYTLGNSPTTVVEVNKFVRGETLRKKIGFWGTALDESLYLATQVMRVAQHLIEDADCYDVEASNVENYIITDKGIAVLVDFGHVWYIPEILKRLKMTREELLIHYKKRLILTALLILCGQEWDKLTTKNLEKTKQLLINRFGVGNKKTIYKILKFLKSFYTDDKTAATKQISRMIEGLGNIATGITGAAKSSESILGAVTGEVVPEGTAPRRKSSSRLRRFPVSGKSTRWGTIRNAVLSALSVLAAGAITYICTRNGVVSLAVAATLSIVEIILFSDLRWRIADTVKAFREKLAERRKEKEKEKEAIVKQAKEEELEKHIREFTGRLSGIKEKLHEYDNMEELKKAVEVLLSNIPEEARGSKSLKALVKVFFNVCSPQIKKQQIARLKEKLADLKRNIVEDDLSRFPDMKAVDGALDKLIPKERRKALRDDRAKLREEAGPIIKRKRAEDNLKKIAEAKEARRKESESKQGKKKAKKDIQPIEAIPEEPERKPQQEELTQGISEEATRESIMRVYQIIPGSFSSQEAYIEAVRKAVLPGTDMREIEEIEREGLKTIKANEERLAAEKLKQEEEQRKKYVSDVTEKSRKKLEAIKPGDYKSGDAYEGAIREAVHCNAEIPELGEIIAEGRKQIEETEEISKRREGTKEAMRQVAPEKFQTVEEYIKALDAVIPEDMRGRISVRNARSACIRNAGRVIKPNRLTMFEKEFSEIMQGDYKNMDEVRTRLDGLREAFKDLPEAGPRISQAEKNWETRLTADEMPGEGTKSLFYDILALSKEASTAKDCDDLLQDLAKLKKAGGSNLLTSEIARLENELRQQRGKFQSPERKEITPGQRKMLKKLPVQLRGAFAAICTAINKRDIDLANRILRSSKDDIVEFGLGHHSKAAVVGEVLNVLKESGVSFQAKSAEENERNKGGRGSENLPDEICDAEIRHAVAYGRILPVIYDGKSREAKVDSVFHHRTQGDIPSRNLGMVTPNLVYLTAAMNALSEEDKRLLQEVEDGRQMQVIFFAGERDSHYGLSYNQIYINRKYATNITELERLLHHELQERNHVVTGMDAYDPAWRMKLGRPDIEEQIDALAREKHNELMLEEKPPKTEEEFFKDIATFIGGKLNDRDNFAFLLERTVDDSKKKILGRLGVHLLKFLTAEYAEKKYENWGVKTRSGAQDVILGDVYGDVSSLPEELASLYQGHKEISGRGAYSQREFMNLLVGAVFIDKTSVEETIRVIQPVCEKLFGYHSIQKGKDIPKLPRPLTDKGEKTLTQLLTIVSSALGTVEVPRFLEKAADRSLTHFDTGYKVAGNREDALLGEALAGLMIAVRLWEAHGSSQGGEEFTARSKDFVNDQTFTDILSFLLNEQDNEALSGTISVTQGGTLFKTLTAAVYKAYGGIEGTGLEMTQKFIDSMFTLYEKKIADDGSGVKDGNDEKETSDNTPQDRSSLEGVLHTYRQMGLSFEKADDAARKKQEEVTIQAFKDALINWIGSRIIAMGKADDRLIIGIDLSWVPQIQLDMAGMTMLLDSIKDISKIKGYENVTVCVKESPEELAEALRREIKLSDKPVKLSNIVILLNDAYKEQDREASKKTVIEEYFEDFRKEGRRLGAYFARVKMPKEYSANIDIDLIRMLKEVLERIARSDCPHEFSVKIPDAEEFDLHDLTEIYRTRSKLLTHA